MSKVRKKKLKKGSNVPNRTLFISDNLPVLEGMNSNSVDLIYLDPPFNSNRNYAAPIGSKAAGVQFKDAWTLDDIDLAWIGQLSERHANLTAIINAVGKTGGKGDKSYLVFMARRLLELHRILKESGSIYLHCDPIMSHSLKLLMDAIFGKRHFRNEIVWHYYNGSNRSHVNFGKKHDIILFYSKTKAATYNWDDMREPYVDNSVYARGTVYSDRGFIQGNARGKLMHDVWRMPSINNMAKERTGYPTQKPLALLERVIRASSNRGDIVLDPFCGCATACVAAEMLDRQWMGVDVSPLAKNLLRSRLENAQDMYSSKGAWRKVSVTQALPVRTDNADLSVNPKEYKHTLYGKQGGVCMGCKVEFPFRNMTLDHIRPQSQGGVDTEDNLQLLCNACNSKKGNRPMDYLIAELLRDGIIGRL